MERGLSDDLNDRHYLIVEATDGRSHYVEIGRGENIEPLGSGAIVRVVPAANSVNSLPQSAAGRLISGPAWLLADCFLVEGYRS